ncbi:hypothetical protein [Pontimicrobium sp. IMCC45349]|uniref:hypothetical protein n=1 Tax=Pontimicrobium sp. IMCC45349 TaxID=3391574 RepID=UPI0039A065AF
MDNVIDIAFSQVNITLSILVIILILYWIFNMISGIDFDLDIDVDVDIDADVDVDVDANLDTASFTDLANAEINEEDVIKDPRKKLTWWQQVLVYFNFVGLPFMFTFTSWIFIWWLCTVIATTLTSSYNTNYGYTLLLAGIVPSLVITKLFTSPFKGFFKNLNPDGDAPINLIGRKGLMLSKISKNKMGSAEIIVDDNPISIYAKSHNGNTIDYKQEIVVIKQSDDKNFYWVLPAEDPNERIVNIEDIKF